jgi:membrane protease YdiL (CAAX protease family)
VAGWLATISGLGLILIGLLTPSGFFFYFLGPLVLTVGLVAGAGNQALERRARGAPYPGPSPYLVLLTIVPATFAIGIAIGTILRAILGPTDVPDSVANLVGVAIQAVVFIGIVRLTVVGTDALTWAQMGWRRLNGEGVRALLLGAATSIPVIGLTAVVAAIVVGLFHEIPESPLPPTGTALGLVIQLLAGAVIAPIAEETVFRGFAITAWERTVGEQGALVRSSLLFALAHVITVSGSSLGEVAGLIVVGFATRLPVGFALGWLYLRTRSIWAPIGLHMTFNGILLVLAEVAKASGAA